MSGQSWAHTTRIVCKSGLHGARAGAFAAHYATVILAAPSRTISNLVVRKACFFQGPTLHSDPCHLALTPSSEETKKRQMPKVLLTDLSIRKLPVTNGSKTWWDTALPAFGIRVGKRARTFTVMTGSDRKRITIGHYPHMTLKEARQKALALLSAKHLPPDAKRVREALTEYIEIQRKKLRSSTLRETQRCLGRLQPYENAALTEVSTQQLTKLIDALADRPAEANATHAKISAFFNWCARRQLIARNPLMGHPMPHKVVTRDRVLTLLELAAIYTHCKAQIHEPYCQMILIIMHTGLRRNEVHSLTWPMLTADSITIPKVFGEEPPRARPSKYCGPRPEPRAARSLRRRCTRRQLSFSTQDQVGPRANQSARRRYMAGVSVAVSRISPRHCGARACRRRR